MQTRYALELDGFEVVVGLAFLESVCKVGGEVAQCWCPFCLLLEGWSALAQSFSQGFRTQAVNSFRRQ